VVAHIELRLNELRRRRDLSQTTATDTEDLGEAADTQTREYQAMRARKRARVERHYVQEEHGRRESISHMQHHSLINAQTYSICTRRRQPIVSLS
jgi:hypothetical protein